MALRQHRLPRFWLVFTLGSVLAAIAGVYWWERQLPGRIEAAVADGRLDDCLRYSEQLAALSWLPGNAPRQQGRCRRDKALQLWRQERWKDAIAMQRLLIASAAGRDDDRERLGAWEGELRQLAMARFRAGDLDGAMAALQPLGEDRGADGNAIGDGFREVWNRNRIQMQRAERLVPQKRWWEALEALNRIDHPWWQERSLALRRQVQQGLEGMKKGDDPEHDSHGALPHTVPPERLDTLVQRRIEAGMDDWQAFEEACRELGGRIVEAGPESACQR